MQYSCVTGTFKPQESWRHFTGTVMVQHRPPVSLCSCEVVNYGRNARINSRERNDASLAPLLFARFLARTRVPAGNRLSRHVLSFAAKPQCALDTCFAGYTAFVAG